MNNETPASLDRTLDALRAVGEHTRLRILLLCAHGELTVGDLTEILDQSQPRVSRHLKLMHEAGVLERHQEGQSVWFRAVTAGPLAALVREMVDQVADDDPQHAADLDRLRTVTHTWEVRARSYFRKHFADWDRVRRQWIDADAVDAAVRNRFETLGARNLLDIGTGTGHVLRLLGRHVDEAVGLDNSRDMLLAARAAIHNAGLPHCQLRQGEMKSLPFADASFDAVSIHLALHYADAPLDALRECARVTMPGGWILLVDFDRHDRSALTDQQGFRWPGFSDRAIRDWLGAAGYVDIETQSIQQPSNQDAPVILFWLARKKGSIQ